MISIRKLCNQSSISCLDRFNGTFLCRRPPGGGSLNKLTTIRPKKHNIILCFNFTLIHTYLTANIINIILTGNKTSRSAITIKQVIKPLILFSIHEKKKKTETFPS